MLNAKSMSRVLGLGAAGGAAGALWGTVEFNFFNFSVKG